MGKTVSRIARACRRIRIKRVAPYSTRHVGMATAKTWISPEHVAASAGHKTTATATAHYARRQAAWRKISRFVHPMPEEFNRVIRPLKANRTENIEYWEGKRREAEEAENEPPTFRP
jgi:tRNA A37 N6-isopentenylltransferase MiaA